MKESVYEAIPDLLDLAPGSVEMANLDMDIENDDAEDVPGAMAAPEADNAEVKRMEHQAPHQMDWSKLDLPEDPEVCAEIVRDWEANGFGVHQIHFSRRGRKGTTERMKMENAHSSGIRARIFKIWKRSGIDLDRYGNTLRAAKALAVAQQIEDGTCVGDLSATASDFSNQASGAREMPVANPVEETVAKEPEAEEYCRHVLLFPTNAQEPLDAPVEETVSGIPAATSDRQVDLEENAHESVNVPTNDNENLDNVSRRFRNYEVNASNAPQSRKETTTASSSKGDDSAVTEARPVAPTVTFLGRSHLKPEEIPQQPPLVPQLAPTHPQAGPRACSHPVFLGKTRGKENIRKVSGKKTEKRGKGKGQEKRKSLRELTKGLNEIRKDIEKREKEVREAKQIQISLRVRKERLERLESSQSPLFDLYRNKSITLGKKCIMCGHVQMRPGEQEASAVPGFPVVIDSNPLNLGIPSSDQVEAGEQLSTELKVEFAARQRRREEEKRQRRNRVRDGVQRMRERVTTGELVDVTVARPPPPLRLGEERIPAAFGGSQSREENLIEIHGDEDDLIELE